MGISKVLILREIWRVRGRGKKVVNKSWSRHFFFSYLKCIKRLLGIKEVNNGFGWLFFRYTLRKKCSVNRTWDRSELCYYKLRAEDGSTSPYLSQLSTSQTHSLLTTDEGATMAEVRTIRDYCDHRKSQRDIDWGGGSGREHGWSWGRCLRGYLRRKRQCR